LNSKYYTYLIVSFIAYVLAQVLFVKNLVLFDTAFCFIYIGFILMMPFQIGSIVLLLAGMITGLVVDVFYDSLGVNMAATVLIAFIRPLWLRAVTPRGGYEDVNMPVLIQMGFPWFITYAIPLIFIHHLVLFYVEAGGLHMFFYTLLKAIFSTILTFIVLTIVQYIFYRSID